MPLIGAPYFELLDDERFTGFWEVVPVITGTLNATGGPATALFIGSVTVAPTPGTTVEERILDQIVAALATISTANGYEQDVAPANIWRATADPEPMKSTPPSLEVRHEGTSSEFHLRGATECMMEVSIICTAEYDAANEKISDLIGDVVKLILSNKRWNDGSVNLARRTWLTGQAVVHETETSESPTTAIVPFRVLFRVNALNPRLIKDI